MGSSYWRPCNSDCGEQELGAGKSVWSGTSGTAKADGLVQNGNDCGIYTTEILRGIISGRTITEPLDQVTPMNIPGCGHRERLHLVNETMKSITEAATLYSTGSDPIPFKEEMGSVPLAVISQLTTGYWRGIDIYTKVLRNLQRSQQMCAGCKTRRERSEVRETVVGQLTGNQRPSGQAPNTDFPRDNLEVEEASDEDDEVDGTYDPHHHLLATSRPLSEGRSKVGGTSDEGDEVDESLDSIDFNYVRAFGPIPEGQGLVTGKAVANRRKREIQAYQFAEARSVGLRSKFCKDFDDYDTGPTEEEAEARYREVRASYTLTPHTSILDTMHTRFDDQGFRRTAGGFHHFYNNPPSIEEQLVHFFPTPPERVLKDRKEKLAAGIDGTELVSGTRKGPFPTSEITGNDVLVWGLDEMVDRGGAEFDNQMRLYITGRYATVVNPDHFIRLDLLRSRKTVNDVRISMDIDSVIWLTDRLKVKPAANIHLLPSTKPEAPISSNNHTFVELYPPRTEKEKARGEMSEQSQLVSISKIPNMHFAHTGKAEGYANITVMFPRMKHKYPLRSKWETKIPFEVQAFWLRHVVYPALRRITEDGMGVYTQGELEDTQFKFEGSAEKTLQIRGPHLTVLVANIHQILRDKQDSDFDGYKSFFFVVDIRGIKASTTCDESSPTDPWDTLLAQHPSLDWEYMESEDNGELLIDIGLGFHPPEGSGMVGFWSMDPLQVGFEYGGYGTGTHHKVNTFSAIGGIHADMPKDRRLKTHILYRLAYNLSYEVLRGHKTRTKTGFFPARSAYEVNQDFLDTVKGVVSAYERSLDKSYSVRDEYRCQASSARRLLPLLTDKVSFGVLSTRTPDLCVDSRQNAIWRPWIQLSGCPAGSGLHLSYGG